MEKDETDVMQIAAYAASDLSSWGMALGEILRVMDLMDKKLAAAVEASRAFHSLQWVAPQLDEDTERRRERRSGAGGGKGSDLTGRASERTALTKADGGG